MTEAEYQFKLATFEEFKALGPEVWRNWDSVKDRVFLGMQKPSGGVKAALLCRIIGNNKQKALGRVIVRMAERYELVLAPSMLTLDATARRKILLHELVHVGYPGHGKDFRKVCTEVGGVVSGAAVSDPGVHMEKKVGHRYKRMKTFETEQEATAWFHSPVEVAKREMERAVFEAEYLKQGMSAKDAKRAAHKMVRWVMVYG